jgi:cytosine/adenosine deaminase-related metal-dependent hydrolase
MKGNEPRPDGQLIYRARYVVTMDGPPIENGAIATSGQRILNVGKAEAVKAAHAGEVIDLGERVLMPGLVNAHCHLDYTCLRGRIPPPNHSFTDWIRAINAEKATLTAQDYIDSIRTGFAEAKRFGTVALGNLTAFPELISKLRPSLWTTWFAELIDVRSSDSSEEHVYRAARALEGADHSGFAPHAPFTASEALYRCCARAAGKNRARLTTHLAESRDEMAMFRDASGPLYEFMKGIGRDMSDCGHATPLARFLSFTDPAQPWLVAHLNELTESDFALLEQARPSLSVVHCPRSHRYFRHTPFPFDRLRALGLKISLGTDSLASNHDLNLFAEMREFQKIWPGLEAEEIVKMTTLNPAEALGQTETLGRVANGSAGAVIAIPYGGSGKDVYDAMVAFDGVPWMNDWGKCPG